jgi:hypothetical protein
MKKLLQAVNCLIFALIFSNYVNAQCGFTGSAITSESRCKESGTITVNVLPSAAYTYQITSGPVTTGPRVINTFNALPKGSYVIRISLGSCSITIPATVAGNYQEPSLLSTTVKNISCPGGTGCITVSQPTKGRAPYSYAITAGPVTRPAQANGSFCSLPAGIYSVAAFDSCGVVRSSNYTIGYDTGRIRVVVYGWDIRFANCNDLILCTNTGFTNTSMHSMIKVWYIKPNGDTLKVNNLESMPISCDTLVGESTTVAHSAPTLYVSPVGQQCPDGYNVVIANMWKYNLQVGYIIRKCSNNQIVYNSTQNPPTTFYSDIFTLENDTCYRIEHFNSCGDTVRATYTAPSKPVFGINACQSTACGVNGKGSISVSENYLTGVKPIVFTIIAGPEGIGTTRTQGANASWVSYKNMALGTYKIAAVDNCGNRDTLDITLDKPLQRIFEITQTPNCSGGADVHVKITSNYSHCKYDVTSPGNVMHITTTSPGYSPVNIDTTSLPSATTPSVWEADYINIAPGSLYMQTFVNNDGCNWDTTVNILGYTVPAINSIKGYVCSASGNATINYNLTGGKPVFNFRIREHGTSTWGAWQTGTLFSGMGSGDYDINVQDVCPNGSITSVEIIPWTKSAIDIGGTCPVIGNPHTLTANPIVDGVTYEWVFKGVVVGTGPSYTIPNFSMSDNGVYKLYQVFPGGGCSDTAYRSVYDCVTMLPILFDKLSGEYKNNTVTLAWNTLSEDPGTKFYLERSDNGRTFTNVTTINGYSNRTGGSYNYNEYSDLITVYYRIRYISNGRTYYSGVVKLTKNESWQPITVSPVPFSSWLSVQFKSTKKEPYLLRLYDVSGKKVLEKSINASAGINSVWLSDELKNLANGIYTVEMATNSFVQRTKVIKSDK